MKDVTFINSALNHVTCPKFSCFFCRKKCFSKERFFSHFRVHFGRNGHTKLSNGKRRHSIAANANCDEASDEGSEDEIREDEKLISHWSTCG